MKIPLKSKESIGLHGSLAHLGCSSLRLYRILIAASSFCRLLYAVFVVSNENSTVAELASTLQADLAQLQAAASFVCRLGWAVKLIDPASVLHDKIMPGSPRAILSDEDDTRASYMSADGEAAQNGDNLGTESSGLRSSHVRVAFIVDANITSYLMMGSVSPGILS